MKQCKPDSFKQTAYQEDKYCGRKKGKNVHRIKRFKEIKNVETNIIRVTRKQGLSISLF